MHDDAPLTSGTSDNYVAGLSPSEIPPYAFEDTLPPPQPPPSINTVTNVPQHEWMHDERQPTLVPYVTDDVTDGPADKQDHGHMLWKTHMFPIEEESDNTYNNAEILRILQLHDDVSFTKPTTTSDLEASHFRLLQADGGANTSVTNDPTILHTWWDINPYTIGGIAGGLTCTRKGLFHLECLDGSIIPVSMYYSADATETVVSPTDIVFANSDKYDTWWQVSNCREGTGELRFQTTEGLRSATVPLEMRNRLWFIRQSAETTRFRARVAATDDLIVNTLQASATHHLWHHRLAHAGQFAMDNVSKVTDGVPSLKRKNKFFHCNICSKAKMTKKTKGYNENPERALVPGGRFHMDYGFVRGETVTKAEDGPLLTSNEGYNCYLLIVDEYSRYMWVFLFASKSPPIETVKTFLATHGLKHGLRRVRTDLGGELARSAKFREMIQKSGYILEPTALGASFQNAIVERPHRTLADMMRSMLVGAGLPSDYWSYAIRHAVYIKNRLPHRHLQDYRTPFQEYTGRIPDLSHLRVFGSRVTVGRPQGRRYKLDNTATTTGIFLGYTASNRNVWYKDDTTGLVKSARHVIFDEAHYMSVDKPAYAAELVRVGEPKDIPQPTTTATTPTSAQSTDGDQTALTGTDDKPSPSTTTTATLPTVTNGKTTTTSPTDATPASSPVIVTPSTMPTDGPSNPRPTGIVPAPIPYDVDEIVHAVTDASDAPTEAPVEFVMSSNPFGPSIDIPIRVRGNNATLGLNLYLDDDTKTLKLRDMTPSTPAHRVPRWRSTLRHSILVAVDDVPVNTVDDVVKHVSSHREVKEMIFTFIPQEHVTSTPDQSIPQIHFDQMNVMSYQHRAARTDTAPWSDPHRPPPITEDMVHAAMRRGHIKQRLTRAFLRKQSDWNDWRLSEFKQLGQYYKQDMFGPPQSLPKGANLLPLIWTYLIKSDGTKKARCVCNGSPRMKGSITLDHTYAAALDQSGARTFWALSVLHGHICIGADATNAFAEAPPPKAPLFVTIDRPFRDWWEQVLKRPPITPGHVMPVRHALQGHPESGRLWAIKIHKILETIGLHSTRHEPCLYTGNIDGERVFLLRQVDDFAISTPTIDLGNKILQKIQSHLRQPMKPLGILRMFNGLDLLQTDCYTKVYCKTYLTKILQGHNWHVPTSSTLTATPMHHDKKYLQQLETTNGPDTDELRRRLQQDQGFSYRQAIGELLFAAVTCRPDILYSVIKLSQYSNNPGAVHYTAVKRVFRYLRSTIDDGLHYWRTERRPDCPKAVIPTIPPDTYDVKIPTDTPVKEAHGYVDADWAGDTKHRKSMSGLGLFLAGAPVVYRSRFQPTISLSSTESEFVAASEAGKLSLYLRSILTQLGLEPHNATKLYEDNDAAIAMANAQRPTRRTRHLDIKHFALLDWTETDQIILSSISTHDNPADGMTKALGPQLFSRHSATLLGKRKPDYCRF